MERNMLGAATSMQFSKSNFSEDSKSQKTFNLREIYKPKPPPQKIAVAIRPPSPKPCASQDLVPRRREFSCEPDLKPIMRKRAKSLPSTREVRRCRNTQVRFVDSLGLDLVDVKFFKASEDPLVPTHVITRLLANSELTSKKKLEISLPYFKPCFSDNMAAEPLFLSRLCQRRVCLERLFCSELGIMGTVQVLNLAFEKEVFVCYSFTDWKTKADCKANWLSSIHRPEPDPQSDVFRFHLHVPAFLMQPGAVLQFAICFRARGEEYWDNNEGCNYKLSCQTYRLTVPSECEDSLLHFI